MLCAIASDTVQRPVDACRACRWRKGHQQGAIGQGALQGQTYTKRSGTDQGGPQARTRVLRIRPVGWPTVAVPSGVSSCSQSQVCTPIALPSFLYIRYLQERWKLAVSRGCRRRRPVQCHVMGRQQARCKDDVLCKGNNRRCSGSKRSFCQLVCTPSVSEGTQHQALSSAGATALVRPHVPQGYMPDPAAAPKTP